MVRGKFVFLGDEKLYLRGVTYGPFAPNDEHPGGFERSVVERDFATMSANGINTVRLYDIPPRWLLDVAAGNGLLVMVGIPWEQHVAFLDDRRRMNAIEERIRSAARLLAGHPAVLCHLIGNEIPAPIVRWYGRRRIERFLERLYHAARQEDPGCLVSYVNYPTTEYLRLPFIDLACFNVFLERRDRLEAYLPRLQNLVGDLPLILTEVGLDSTRHGEELQAEAVDWQVRSCFAAGAAGVYVFSWTDEWHRGGYEIEDWSFGLVTRERERKPALEAVRSAFEDVPLPPVRDPPRISVVVCTRNGAATLGDCLDGVARLRYPDYEVIVVSDGSTDSSAAIAAARGVRLIEIEPAGLACARNAGIDAATGEIVAFIDDDARPDPDWLVYLADAFRDPSLAAVGGPNLPFVDDGPVASCVAHAPGGPTHVLLDDREAEQIPGCNMAVRKARLDSVGGFDPRFSAAGDDVDMCWRLRERGWKLGFTAAAVVWHHRRGSIRGYLRQQRGYGKAEALLEEKWPDQYNASGHVAWHGRIYDNGAAERRRRGRSRVYFGMWGTSPFQSLYQPAEGLLKSLPLMPEWYLLVAGLAAMTAVGAAWHPLLLWSIPLVLAVSAVIVDALHGAYAAYFRNAQSRSELLALRALTALLHVLQPVARLYGRIANGLTPWRRRGPFVRGLPAPGQRAVWSEVWVAADDRLEALRLELRRSGAVAVSGGYFDRWDLEVRTGTLAKVRVGLVIEEHEEGTQLVRFRWRPKPSLAGSLLWLVLGAMATTAAAAGALVPAIVFAIVAAAALLRQLFDAAQAVGEVRAAVAKQGRVLRRDGTMG